MWWFEHIEALEQWEDYRREFIKATGHEPPDTIACSQGKALGPKYSRNDPLGIFENK